MVSSPMVLPVAESIQLDPKDFATSVWRQLSPEDPTREATSSINTMTAAGEIVRCDNEIMRLLKRTRWMNKPDKEEGFDNVAFYFQRRSGLKMFSSTEVARLIRGKTILFLGNSMLNRLTMSTAIMQSCCPDKPPMPRNSDRYWVDRRVIENSQYKHGAYAYVLRHGQRPLNLHDTHGTERNYRREFLESFEHNVPIVTCPPSNHSTHAYVRRYSIDCDMGASLNVSKDDDEATVLMFKYTDTPQDDVENWILTHLSSSSSKIKTTHDRDYSFAQREVDIVVIQLPADVDHGNSQDHAPRRRRDRILEGILKVRAYEETTKSPKRKMWIVYGQTCRGNTSVPMATCARKRKELKRKAQENINMFAQHGIFYIPLEYNEEIAMEDFGLAHELSNLWHFMDVGQHFITQTFLNVLQISRRCSFL